MADTVITGAGQGIYLVRKGSGRTVVQGLNETREKFLEMGGDRNLFEKWMKEAAQVAAREATRTAPRMSGNLALSVRGYASKKMAIKSRATGKVTDRMVFGGIIAAGSARVRNTVGAGGVVDSTTTGVQYARAVSLGTYHVAGATSKVGGRTWRTNVRGKQNPYMIKARESKKSYMVTLLNFKLGQYIKQKGFKTNGL
jgi:hypothetical protein